ncbi:MAG: glycosyltransferase [Chlorobi bacterium]|nr:glycosyltransferase [Chlorobiota bacterium]MCI0716541.1 glycosyltransferase [Chlorobiota bacterium]
MDNRWLETPDSAAFVMFNNGAFGGAEKRFTSLFLYLSGLYPGKFYFIVNRHLFNHLNRIFAKLSHDYIIVIGEENAESSPAADTLPKYYKDAIPDPLEIDAQASLARKIYWYYKNRYKQKKLFKEIENLRKELSIKVFAGIFSGVLPLVFYMQSKPKNASVIFSNMDSWFTDVHSDMKKLWYRKYYSFNYAMENSDFVDFLSPYILEGVKKRNLSLKDDRVFVSPCSFADYENCKVGDKTNFEIAFCSRLEPNKNPLMFLEAAKIIHGKYPEVKFHILGEGTLVPEVEKFIKNNGLLSVINFQFLKNPSEIFTKTSVFISLQTNTNYPSQSVLEAMACGNAVIASKCGDTGLFINEKNGILIDLDTGALINAIEMLIKNPPLAKNMGIEGRKLVTSHHTIEKFSDYYLSLIKEAYKKIQ